MVPHSHWDREWYATFEEFRFYLVQFMDELVELLESDEGFRSFLLDGQVSLLDDYLEVRPENRDRLVHLIREGRLEIGPWYVQPDEFLVSGEALVRNLLLGDSTGRGFGPVMKQGYVPDTFGHISQLPQILRGFGIETFYFMRGLGEDVDKLRTEFWWEAPDGSKVLAHFLSETYSNAAVLGSDPARISFRHDRLSDPSSYLVRYDSLFELRDRLAGRAANRTILLLNGSDHVTVQPSFSRYVSDLNHSMDDYLFNGKLGDFASLVLEKTPELNTLDGELRSARYQPILKGTYSSRIYLKQENERAQQLLEGLAERASAVAYASGGRDYSPFLKYAWRELIKNHAHDSIGGCSVDAVHQQMMGRFDTIKRVGHKVVDESLGYIASRVAPASKPDLIPIVVFNPSPWERGGKVSVEVSLDADVPFRRRVFDWIGKGELNLNHSSLVDPEGSEISFNALGERLHIEDALYRRKSVRRTTIEFNAGNVPPLGYKVFQLQPSSENGQPESTGPEPKDGVLENEFLRITAEDNGTLSLLDKRFGITYKGLNRLVDEGDAGDEYNFSPPTEQTKTTFLDTEWTVESNANPHTFTMKGDLNLHRALVESRSSRSEETVRCPAIVEVRLLPGSQRVEISTEFYNRARDHRLRAVFPSGMAVEKSVAETAFGTVERPTKPQDSAGWREKDSAVYAQRRFVCVGDSEGGLAVLNKGLPEYEVTPEGEILLTLLRSVGWLSRSDLSTRIGSAGPEIATPEAQCPGRHVFEYAITPYTGDRFEDRIYQEAEEFWLPLEARAIQRVGLEEPSSVETAGSFLEVSGAGVVLSTLKKAGDKDGLILRLFNSSKKKTEARICFSSILVSKVYRTNLNEEILDEVAFDQNEWSLSLERGRIETLLVQVRKPREAQR